MTQAELDALPEDGTFSVREELRDGKVVRIPVLNTVGALWHGGDDEPVSVVDSHGQRWMVGYSPDGTRYKRRMG